MCMYKCTAVSFLITGTCHNIQTSTGNHTSMPILAIYSMENAKRETTLYIAEQSTVFVIHIDTRLDSLGFV